MTSVRLAPNKIEELLRHPWEFGEVFVQDIARPSDEFKKAPYDREYNPIGSALDRVGACEENGGLHVAFAEGFFQVFKMIHETCHPNVDFSEHSDRIMSFCKELDRIPRGCIVNQIDGFSGAEFVGVVKKGKEFCKDSNYACHHLMVGLVVFMKDIVSRNEIE